MTKDDTVAVPRELLREVVGVLNRTRNRLADDVPCITVYDVKQMLAKLNALLGDG